MPGIDPVMGLRFVKVFKAAPLVSFHGKGVAENKNRAASQETALSSLFTVCRSVRHEIRDDCHNAREGR